MQGICKRITFNSKWCPIIKMVKNESSEVLRLQKYIYKIKMEDYFQQETMKKPPEV